ncbi:hypothetical protein ACWG0P_12070 [Amedibacillus sp. YH-ame6]
MFAFLKEIYQNRVLTLTQLEEEVIHYNKRVSKSEKLNVVNLSEGGYVSIQKYLALNNKLKTTKDELQYKDQTCMEMHMRISILEQRLKAYELMMSFNPEEYKKYSKSHV